MANIIGRYGVVPPNHLTDYMTEHSTKVKATKARLRERAEMDSIEFGLDVDLDEMRRIALEERGREGKIIG